MRLTCLICGSQVEITVQEASLEQLYYCICGKEHVYPNLLEMGARPNDAAAILSRSRAFRVGGVLGNEGLER